MFANQLLLACPGLMNLLAFLTFAALAEAHIAAFTKGMYCENVRFSISPHACCGPDECTRARATVCRSTRSRT
jgi:hypothetical protein